MKNHVLILKAKALWQNLLKEDASPNQVAAGFALGLFARFLPLPWLHTGVALLLAFLFRSNRVAALVGVEIYLPFFAGIPLLYFCEYFVGSHILGWHLTLEFNPRHIDLMNLLVEGWDVFLATLVGSVAIGVPVVAVSFCIMRRMAALWQVRRNSDREKQE